MVGNYAFAQAIAAPVFLTVGLNLRIVRATDVDRRWTAKQYNHLRFLLNLISIALCVTFALLAPTASDFILVMLAIALGKSSEAASQVAYGYFQMHERLDMVARSLLLRAVAGPLPFTVGLLITHNLAASCLMLAGGWLCVALLHDKPVEARLRTADQEDPVRPAEQATLTSLVRTSLSLGISGGISSVTINMPRYAVQFLLGPASLGLFAALAYLGQVIAMITGSLADSMLGRLTRSARTSDRAGFTRHLGILMSFSLGISLSVVALAAVLGEPFTRILLGDQYVNQPVLIALLIGGAALTCQRILGRGLQAGRRFREVLFMNVVAAFSTAVAASYTVPVFGLIGAAWTLGIGSTIGCVFGSYSVIRLISAMNGQPTAIPHKRAT